jgi:predicted metal-dependent hydrolase
MIQHTDRIKYGSTIIPYNVIKTKRIKTSEVIVDANTITVRTPLDKGKSDIQKLIQDKASWILKKQKEYKETIPQITKPFFKENTTLPYLGINYPLRITKNGTRNSIEFVNGRFIAEIRSARYSHSIVKELYENWITEKAQNIFEVKVGKYSEKLEVKVKKVVVRNLKNRWGSITKDGVINLNSSLLKAPEDVVEYIVTHELCHLKIREHSHRFWDMLHKYMPNYCDKIEWLKINGSNLL